MHWVEAPAPSPGSAASEASPRLLPDSLFCSKLPLAGFVVAEDVDGVHHNAMKSLMNCCPDKKHNIMESSLPKEASLVISIRNCIP